MELDSASSPKGTWLTPSAAFYCSLPTPDGLLGCNPQTLAEEQEKGPPGCRPATVRPAWVSQELKVSPADTFARMVASALCPPR